MRELTAAELQDREANARFAAAHLGKRPAGLNFANYLMRLEAFWAEDTQNYRLARRACSRAPQGLELYEILTPRPEGLGIAQFGARWSEIREAGFFIHNETSKRGDTTISKYFVLATPWDREWEELHAKTNRVISQGSTMELFSALGGAQ